MSFPRGWEINEKTNYPDYSRSLLFELHCYDCDRITNFNPKMNFVFYMKKNTDNEN